jgi:hypothetical protein
MPVSVDDFVDCIVQTPGRGPGRRFLAALFLAGAWAGGLIAQVEWRSTLYPENWTPPAQASFESDRLVQDFSHAGYGRGEVPLPAVAGPVFDAISYGADASGVADSTIPIQAAIDAAAAAGGGVVRLAEGTFRVSPQGTSSHALRIASSGIVLRGAGAGRTFLLNTGTQMRSRSIIRVEGSTSSWTTVPAGSPVATVTSDLPGPTTIIPVSSVAGFAVGDWVVLRADATDAFIAEHGMTDLWAGYGSSLVGVHCLRQIVSVDPALSRLTVDVPTRYYFKVRDNARVHRAVTHVEQVGLEGFSIGNVQHPQAASATGWTEEDYSTAGLPSYDVHDSWAISLRRVRHAWITDVASFRAPENTLNTHLLSNGILLLNCRFVTVRGCDFQRPLYGGGGGNGYMYRLQSSNECLLQDCTTRHCRHGFVFSHMGCSGNVIHRGLAQRTRTQAAAPGTTSGEGCDHHMHLSQSNLIDGVRLDGDYFTAHYRPFAGPPQHGHGGTHTVFWNLVGVAYQPGKSYIVMSDQARYGYIIGTRGVVSGTSTPSQTRTLPVDHVEGAGRGELLRPLSLFDDQVARRLGGGPGPSGEARIVNFSTRALVGDAAGTPILGFTNLGGAGKRMLIRAIGPGLEPFGVAGFAGDPHVALESGGVFLANNDSWRAADEPIFDLTGAFRLRAGSRDAALVADLLPQPHTLPVGVTGPGGIVLLEAYDADPDPLAARLVNASVRAHVGSGDAVLIPGFVLQGAGHVLLLVRTIGPSLARFEVPNVLSDPQVVLYAGGTPIAANDNWSNQAASASVAAAAAQVGAFTLTSGSRDAALLVSLQAGSYTIHASGVGGATGTALVEMYVVR